VSTIAMVSKDIREILFTKLKYLEKRKEKIKFKILKTAT